MDKSNAQIKCGACGEWSWIPVDFFPEDARNIIYRGLECPNCTYITLLVRQPGGEIGIVDSEPTFAVAGRAFGYYFPPVPFIPEDLENMKSLGMRKARKNATKKNKRRWKIVYKGKMKEDENNPRHPSNDRKTKARL